MACSLLRRRSLAKPARAAFQIKIKLILFKILLGCAVVVKQLRPVVTSPYARNKNAAEKDEQTYKNKYISIN
ncbi:hypothetical protein CKO_02845 [Citrobacter koseri ATCC BAA-895]|uniref:Uncharacterized protein n=1 Tax=Citrobacter koseri (strain ATCC BAA-895 / CDC 4225-83 / SGSC4696) TaxID=290338 RepID=A8AKD9_CITK8|nr:hypothetical protein CKO_02845 [Citrobacter koseri ATCC BAA-895]